MNAHETTARPTTTVVVMGVAASGKSTVMTALAARLGWPTAEGDDLHPRENVRKMAAGIALTDEDRWPWLDAVAARIGEEERHGRDAIVTCSALRRAYRDRLRVGHPSVWFAHLIVPSGLLVARIAARTDHFMPATLLTSQLATLEPLAPDEPGIGLDATAALDVVVDRVVTDLARDGRIPTD